MTIFNAHKYMQKILVIVDTNNLHNEGNKSKPNNFVASKGFVKFIEDRRKNFSFYSDIYVSEITIKELLNHQKGYIEEKNQKTLTKDEELDLENKINKYFENEGVNILDFNSVDLKDLVERAINTPPFIEKGKKRGGFKDAVIWESVLKSDKLYKDRSAKFFVFTNDKDFNKEYLESEFRQNYNNINIEILNSDNWGLLTDKLRETFFELYANSNLQENDLIEYLNTKLLEDDSLCQTRTKIQYVDKDIVEISSRTKRGLEIIVQYNYKDKKIIEIGDSI